jgi:signal transduction histidine kinase
MKIKTQSWFLVSGIIMVPLLMMLSYVLFQKLFVRSDRSELPGYEDISAWLNETASARDWESARYTVRRFQRRGETAVFREDYFVLYSTIPEFTSGVSSSRENVRAFLDSNDQMSDYTFVTLNMKSTKVFILNRAIRPPHIFRSILPAPYYSEPRTLDFPAPPPPFFVPSVMIITFIVLLIVFAICMSIVITRSVSRSVQVLEGATRRIAEGELDLNVDVKGSNEITSLAKSLNKMRNDLKEKELARSRFIMGISHDLKTPLALIQGYAEAIEDGVVEDPVSRSGAVEIIIDKAGQLEGMINDLINFVQMETGEWREQLQDIDIAAFLRNFTQAVAQDVELLRHEFVSDIRLPAALSVPMDKKLAQRALENLIGNAVRYSPDGSQIRFAAALVENAVQLTVNDNGMGIEKEALPRVFEMFYRGSASRREPGMGLGLAVVKWVVDYHGWSIAASSEKGAGASFVITIPLAAYSL